MTVQNSELIVEDGTGLSLMGGDIEIRGDGDATQQLVANSGNINLVSVGASGEAAITPQGIDSDDFSQGGTIRLQDSVIHANNALEEPGTGAISIQGGELVMENSEISANTNQASSDNIGIEVNAKQNITLSASTIRSNNGDMGESVPINLSAEGDILLRNQSVISTNSHADSGNINISAQNLTVESQSNIKTVTYAVGDTGGDIHLSVKDSVFITGSSKIYSSTGESPGNTGDIFIDTPELRLENQSVLSTLTKGSGNAGDITLSISELMVSGGLITSRTSSSGHAGSITVTVDSLTLSKGGTISSIVLTADATGNSGSIHINAEDSLTIEGYAESGEPYITPSQITTRTLSTGDAGNIKVSAPVVDIDTGWLDASSEGDGASGSVILRDIERLSLTGGGKILAQTHASGEGGRIDIEADAIHISGDDALIGDNALYHSGIYTSSRGSGHAGNLIIQSKNLVLDQRGRLESIATGSGNAGNINITVDSLTLSKGSKISSSAWNAEATGKGGSIHINAADSLTIEGYAEHNGTRTPSLIATNTNTVGGDTGDIRISAPVVDIDQGLLSASSSGSGASGSVILRDIERLSLTGGGRIQASNLATGEGSQVDIEADTIHISGYETSDSNDWITPSGIYIDSSGSGHAGNLILKSKYLVLDQRGKLQSAASGSGNAGNIFIGTPESPVVNLTLLDGSIINTSTKGSGNAGNIHINAMGAVTLQPQSLGAYITSSTRGTDSNGLGSAGTITLNAHALNILSGGNIATNTQSHHGTPANIQISVNDLLIQGDDTSTLQAIAAIENGQQSQILATGIASNATANQRGGNITINAAHQALLYSGIISASGGGAGGGGDIFFGNSASPSGLLIINQNSAIFARAQQGNGGNIFIFPGTFLREGNPRINADSTLGNSGMVEIDNVEQGITHSILDLDSTLMGPDLLIRQACDVDRIQQQSHLTVGGQDGFRQSPGDYIPSKMSRIPRNEGVAWNRLGIEQH
jgi:large exoprotein involved in heme utilization and adhesion